MCGEYNWLTYAEVDARARAFGRGLAALGQQVKENILLFSETKAEWIISAQGCFAQNFPGKKWDIFVIVSEFKHNFLFCFVLLLVLLLPFHFSLDYSNHVLSTWQVEKTYILQSETLNLFQNNYIYSLYSDSKYWYISYCPWSEVCMLLSFLPHPISLFLVFCLKLPMLFTRNISLLTLKEKFIPKWQFFSFRWQKD